MKCKLIFVLIVILLVQISSIDIVFINVNSLNSLDYNVNYSIVKDNLNTHQSLQSIFIKPDISSKYYHSDNNYFSARKPKCANIGKDCSLVGQCTWYVYGRIQETGVVNCDNRISKLFTDIDGSSCTVLTDSQGEKIFNGNAGSWDDIASSIGLRVDSNPEPGCIAVWKSGHVAFVENVIDNNIYVSESNMTSQVEYMFLKSKPGTANSNDKSDVIVCCGSQPLYKDKSFSSTIVANLSLYQILESQSMIASEQGGAYWHKLIGYGDNGKQFEGYVDMRRDDPVSSNVTGICLEPSTPYFKQSDAKYIHFENTNQKDSYVRLYDANKTLLDYSISYLPGTLINGNMLDLIIASILTYKSQQYENIYNIAVEELSSAKLAFISSKRMFDNNMFDCALDQIKYAILLYNNAFKLEKYTNDIWQDSAIASASDVYDIASASIRTLVCYELSKKEIADPKFFFNCLKYSNWGSIFIKEYLFDYLYNNNNKTYDKKIWDATAEIIKDELISSMSEKIIPSLGSTDKDVKSFLKYLNEHNDIKKRTITTITNKAVSLFGKIITENLISDVFNYISSKILEPSDNELFIPVRLALNNIAVKNFNYTSKTIDLQFDGSKIKNSYKITVIDSKTMKEVSSTTLFPNTDRISIPVNLQKNTIYIIKAIMVQNSTLNIYNNYNIDGVNNSVIGIYETEAYYINIGQKVIVANTSKIGLNIRTNPDLTSKVIKAVQEGTIFEVIDGPVLNQGYTWWKIQNLDIGIKEGWAAYGDWIKPKDNNGFSVGSNIIINRSVNRFLKKQTDINMPLSTEMNDKMEAKILWGPILSQGYVWYFIQTNDGRIGWFETAPWLMPIEVKNNLSIMSFTPRDAVQGEKINIKLISNKSLKQVSYNLYYQNTLKISGKFDGSNTIWYINQTVFNNSGDWTFKLTLNSTDGKTSQEDKVITINSTPPPPPPPPPIYDISFTPKSAIACKPTKYFVTSNKKICGITCTILDEKGVKIPPQQDFNKDDDYNWYLNYSCFSEGTYTFKITIMFCDGEYLTRTYPVVVSYPNTCLDNIIIRYVNQNCGKESYYDLSSGVGDPLYKEGWIFTFFVKCECIIDIEIHNEQGLFLEKRVIARPNDKGDDPIFTPKENIKLHQAGKYSIRYRTFGECCNDNDCWRWFGRLPNKQTTCYELIDYEPEPSSFEIQPFPIANDIWLNIISFMDQRGNAVNNYKLVWEKPEKGTFDVNPIGQLLYKPDGTDYCITLKFYVQYHGFSYGPFLYQLKVGNADCTKITPPQPPAIEPSDDWSSFGGTPENNRIFPDKSGLNGSSVKTSFKITLKNVITSSPSIVNNKAYFGSWDGKLYCLDANNGSKIWDFQTRSWIISSPAISNGYVYFGSLDGCLYCVDSNTGNKNWEFKTGSGIASPPMVFDGKIYFGSGDGKLYCLDANNGSKIWDFQSGGGICNSPAISNGKVFFGSNDFNMYCIDLATGEHIWYYHTAGGVNSSPVISNDRVYFGSNDKKLYCLNLANGDKVWEYSTTGIVRSTPVVFKNKVFFGSGDGRFICVDSTNADKIWDYLTGGGIYSSACVANNRVYFGSNDHKLYCINLDNGQKIWEFKAQNHISSSPSLSNGKVYFGGYDNNFYCLESAQ